MRTWITGGTIVNEGRTFAGSVCITDDRISNITTSGSHISRGTYDQVIDATGCFVLPGIIDEHVHFREPGLTSKADIESESRAAAWGGVTTYFDMPNTVPQTTTIPALEDKFRRAREESHVNYSFFIGATNDNATQLDSLDIHRIPGVKLFMGASTGNMLVDNDEALKRIFSHAHVPVMVHCEDMAIINHNLRQALQQAQDGDLPVTMHSAIRSREACLASTRRAVALAKHYGTCLHVAHVSTADELELFGNDPRITAEATVSHLIFCDEDYDRLGALIKCNPAIKTHHDRDTLRRALVDGRITTIGTDHAPHLLTEKQGGAVKAASGIPMIQFALPAMLELVEEGILTLSRMVSLMCHHPARLFEVRERGYLRPGYKADITIVRPHAPWTVTPNIIQSKCRWSPLTGHTFQWRIERTLVNGHTVYEQGRFDPQSRGEEVIFR